MIPVDAVFSPVKQVSYKVENSRVGQVTDFDKLTLNIETDGSMTPRCNRVRGTNTAGPASVIYKF